MANPESIRILATEANTSAGGVRGQPAVNVWHLRSQTENKSAAQLSVCVPGCQVNKQTGANWVTIEIRVRPWPQASTSLLVPHHHQRPLLVHLLAQQIRTYCSFPPCEILLQLKAPEIETAPLSVWKCLEVDVWRGSTTVTLLTWSCSALMSSAVPAVQDDPWGAFDWFSATFSGCWSVVMVGSPHTSDIWYPQTRKERLQQSPCFSHPLMLPRKFTSQLLLF